MVFITYFTVDGIHSLFTVGVIAVLSLRSRITDSMLISSNISIYFNVAVSVSGFIDIILYQIVTPVVHSCYPVDPTFISSSFIPDEEKIYFFFSEVGREYDFIDKFIVSRVSQICMVRKRAAPRMATVLKSRTLL